MTAEKKTQRKLSLHKLIPNIITLTAMAAGASAIKYAITGNWEKAVLAIVAAAFLDAFDGAAARLLKASSKLGAELDSLSDFVSFGVAPALVIYLWTVQTAGKFGWITALIFMMAVALRLARFNVSKTEEASSDPLSKYFTGVPSPVGAGLALLPLIVCFQLDKGSDSYFIVSNASLVALWLMVLSAMMVSHIPTFSSKQIRVTQRMAVPLLAALGILISGLINEPWPTLTFMGAAYLLSLPLSVRHYARKKKSLAEGIRDPDDISDDE